MSVIIEVRKRIDRDEPYYLTRYVCTNKDCRYKRTFILAKRRNCPKCNAHIEVIDVVLKLPKDRK